MFATSSLDGTIRIWSNDNFVLTAEFTDVDQKKSEKNSNINGVRVIDYTPELGGCLVSTGYSSYVNVWSPGSSLSKSYVGRLEGHSAIVVCCKFFPLSYRCLSVDETGNMKIWDLRNLIAIQTIRNDG